jgi:N-ethylmaleimide reductase
VNPEPRELSDDEVKEIVQEFVAAAKRAVHIAGFDGVEVHGANGYLIDQFLCENSNKRTSGPYAGETLETRTQFLTEVLEAVVEEVGADRVGLRISPLNSYQDMNRFGIDNAVAEVKHIVGICNGLDLAYMHVMRADFFGIQSGDVVTPARETFKNILTVHGGYEAEEAEEGIEAGKFDAVAFGTKFIANPDFPERVKVGAAMNVQRPELYYTKKAAGYTDYPFTGAAA